MFEFLFAVVSTEAMTTVAEVLEILMLVCFGCSWPISVYKSIQTKSSKGKSSLFNILIIVGYIGGIISKFLKMGGMSDKGTMTQVVFYFALAMYFVNITIVSVNLYLYYYYKAQDKKKEAQRAPVTESEHESESAETTVEK